MSYIVNVPIEPLKERYSEQWLNWFEAALQLSKIPYITILPKSLTFIIEQGKFLDSLSTIHFKNTQVAIIAEKTYNNTIPKDAIFLIHDGWFPIEQLAYIRDTMKYDWRFIGMFHAGTYDKWDYLSQQGLGYWGKEIENGWFKIYDKIIVSTEFHKQLLCKNRKIKSSKIWQIFFPILYKEFVKQDLDKENIVIFPHRLDIEKQPEIFRNLAKKYEGYKGFKFIATKDIWTTKEEYYSILNKAKISISCALQETWGIAMLESFYCGCRLIVPRRLSYKELYPSAWQYNSDEELEEQLLESMELLEFSSICQDTTLFSYKEQYRELKTKPYRFFDTLFEHIKNL